MGIRYSHQILIRFSEENMTQLQLEENLSIRPYFYREKYFDIQLEDRIDKTLSSMPGNL